ncbi:MAG: S9 family peptidase [Ardenticatenaceae bacterium]|nr:S9 family peptidase [Ardenticatenaceae bacterium]
MKPLQLDEHAPWKERFRAPQVLSARLARRNPGRGLALSNLSGLYQLYRWDPASNALSQLTHRPDGTLSHYFAPDGRYVYYLDDHQGNEIGHMVRIPYEGGPEEDLTPDLPPFSPAGFALSLGGNALGFMAGTPAGFHLYYLPLDEASRPGTARLLYHSPRLLFGPTLSYNGEIAVLASTERTGRPDFALVAIDTTTGEQLGELWDGEGNSLTPIMFSPRPGDMRLLARSNRTGQEQLLLWHPRTGERTDLIFEGLTASATAADWSDDGRRILFYTFEQAVQQMYVYDLVAATLTRLNHPAGAISAPYFAPGGEIMAHLQDATQNTRLVALDERTGEQKRVVLQASQAPPGRAWQSITFPAVDGQAIHGWLALPEGSGPFPTIIDMIGGPGGVQGNTFSPQAQAWLDHGFAWLSVNYRGCATFGREFETKIYGDVGHWEVEDIVAARAWLVAQGHAIPNQVLLTGWSYGGYLTLMSLSKYPDLWAGGMAGIAIADWRVQYEDSAEMLRGFQVALLGGTPESAPEQYAASSPITFAAQVQAPLIVIQGRNDSRTPARPMVLYEEKMRALGKDITVHWFETGHLGGFADAELGIAHQEHFLRFAYRVLG